MISQFIETDTQNVLSVGDVKAKTAVSEHAYITFGSDVQSVLTVGDVRAEMSASEHPYITRGGSFGRKYISGVEEYSIIAPALKAIREAKDKQLAEKARQLLLKLLELVGRFRMLSAPLRAFNADDGSILIEWIFHNFRIGFTIEPKQEESGWYLVSNKELGEIHAYGYLSGMDNRKLLAWLFGFVMTNS